MSHHFDRGFGAVGNGEGIYVVSGFDFVVWGEFVGAGETAGAFETEGVSFGAGEVVGDSESHLGKEWSV